MKSFGRVRLAAAAACLCALSVSRLGAQTPQPATPQSPAPSQPAQQQTPPPQPARPSPFENVPRAAPPAPAPAPAPQGAEQPAQQAQPQFETPTAPAPQAPELPAQLAGRQIEAIEFRGARRVPQDLLRAMIGTKIGDEYSEELVRRDFMQLWNTGRFDDIRLELEPGRTGLVLRFVVTERRVIRSIDYVGIHSVTVSEILDRFKERKVGLSTESQYDPNKVQRAVVVLKEFLGERGREYAEVEPIIEQLPPSTLKLTFRVNEGPKVKVGKIEILGNKEFSDRFIRRQMKALRPIGIPKSIILENIFSKTYDIRKLESDKEDIRQAYLNEGYWQAKVLDEQVDVVRRGGEGWRIPLFHMNAPSIHADVTLPIEEGRQFRLRNINFQGFKLFRTEVLMTPLFRMNKGDVFSADKLRKGLEELRNLYGVYGYMDFVPEPEFEFDPNTPDVDLTLTADEGKQYFIRRIDFAGNTTTRDKVIRRELMLDEGDHYNSQLWEMSILRLNQLGYFEMLKKEDAADIKRNSQSNTVDIRLNVKERGKNTIGMNGGVSGIAGSFVGFNYSTNNFLGLGETLSIDSQLGTRMNDVSFGFTEPYLFDRPIQAGFVVYLRRFSFDQGREASILAGANLMPLYNTLGSENLLNYTQNSKGFSASLSTHLRRSFAQVGITYGYDNSSIATDASSRAAQYFQYINFTGVEGPSALSGIRTSHVVPSYSYNTVNHPISPNAGRSVYVSLDVAGGILGGNVNTIRPTVDLKYFKQAPWMRSHVLAFHAMGSTIVGYRGKAVPPTARTFIGGEQDVRGFEIWGISPVTYIPSSAQVAVLNDNFTERTQKVVRDGKLVDEAVTMQIPTYEFTLAGGDTQMVGNFEYRIPIAGPVTLSAFADAGVNKILRPDQLKIIGSRVRDLNMQFPQAGFDGKVRIAPGTQKIRSSLGLELSVLLPIVQAPFRVYFAYNPSVLRTNLQPPIVADRASFPNYATFYNSAASVGQAIAWPEKRTMFRFTIGKTF